MNLARMEEPAPMKETASSASADQDTRAAPPVRRPMMSAAQDLVTPAALWSVWIWTTGLSATAGMGTPESSARPTSTTASRHRAGMVASARTLLATMSADVLKDGLARTVRRMRRAAVRPLVRTMPSVWIFSKISSVPAHLVLMVRSVRPHLRGALVTHA